MPNGLLSFLGGLGGGYLNAQAQRSAQAAAQQQRVYQQSQDALKQGNTEADQQFKMAQFSNTQANNQSASAQKASDSYWATKTKIHDLISGVDGSTSPSYIAMLLQADKNLDAQYRVAPLSAGMPSVASPPSNTSSFPTSPDYTPSEPPPFIPGKKAKRTTLELKGGNSDSSDDGGDN